LSPTAELETRPKESGTTVSTFNRLSNSSIAVLATCVGAAERHTVRHRGREGGSAGKKKIEENETGKEKILRTRECWK